MKPSQTGEVTITSCLCSSCCVSLLSFFLFFLLPGASPFPDPMGVWPASSVIAMPPPDCFTAALPSDSPFTESSSTKLSQSLSNSASSVSRRFRFPRHEALSEVADAVVGAESPKKSRAQVTSLARSLSVSSSWAYIYQRNHGRRGVSGQGTVCNCDKHTHTLSYLRLCRESLFFELNSGGEFLKQIIGIHIPRSDLARVFVFNPF